MADYSKILEIRDKQLDAGSILPDSLLDDIKNLPALTDEFAAESLITKYPYEFPGVESEEVTLPTLGAMFSLIKELKDDPENVKGGRKAWQKFVDDFPKKAAEWKKKIVNDKRFGERGWKTFYDLWKQASKDKMYMDIAKARRNIAEGWDENGNFEAPSGPWPSQWGTLGRWPASLIMGLLAPRTKEAIAQGRDPSISEQAMDIVQNLAYAAPIGGAEAAAARAIGNPFWRKVAGATAGAALAPTAVTTLDYLLGTKDFANIGDAAIDAGIGTATNLGVGKALAPGLSALANLGSVRGRLPAWAREYLEGPRFATTKARDIIDDAERAVDKHFRTSNADYAKALQEGKPTGRLTDEQLMDNMDIIAFRDYHNSPWMEGFPENWNRITTSDQILMPDGKHYSPITNVREPMMPTFDKNGKMLTEGWDDLYTAQMKKKDLADMVLGAVDGARLTSKEQIAELMSSAANYLKANGGRIDAALARAMTKHPELISLAFNEGLLKDPAFVKDAFRTWLVNKAGNDAAAARILSQWGIDPADIREFQDEMRKEKAISGAASAILSLNPRASVPTSSTSSNNINSASSTAVSEILDTEPKENLSEDSRKYLKQIADNPEIMVYGHPDPAERDKFNLWLLTEGNNLLRGTKAARPTWEVQ